MAIKTNDQNTNNHSEITVTRNITDNNVNNDENNNVMLQ